MAANPGTPREVRFTLPSSLSAVLTDAEDCLSRDAFEAFVLSLRQQGRISAGFAAELLGLSLWELYDLLAARGLAVFNYEEDDFQEEIDRIRAAGPSGSDLPIADAEA